MKKRFLIFLLFPYLLFSFDFKSIDALYEVKYGIFGTVGDAKASVEIIDGTYKIKMTARATGFAKVLSGGRLEVYESTGSIKNGKFLPLLFIQKKSYSSKNTIKRYFFDHKNKEITVIKTKEIDGIQKESRKILDYYAQDDILTLFFNIKSIFGSDFAIENPTVLYAVGANKKDGHVDIFEPKGRRLKEIKKLLEEDDNILVAVINQKIFSSEKGELFLNLNDQGICTKALLKDVVLFGDIRGELVSLDTQ